MKAGQMKPSTSPLKDWRFQTLALACLSAAFAVPRALPGIPMGVDSSSHLYKITFMYDSYRLYGFVSDWSPGWYGGFSLFQLYPPLSYYLVFYLALAGLGPIAAYKLVELLFYIAAPITVYFLALELGLSRTESFASAAAFALAPSVVENLLFYDRFPNLIAFPVMNVFLMAFHKLLTGKLKFRYAAVPGLLLAALILTHHLTALLAFSVALLMALAEALANGRIRESLIGATAVPASSIAASSFWLVPFASKALLADGNPFYNRNVLDAAYMKATYFIQHTVAYSLGAAAFALAMATVVGPLAWLGGRRGKASSILFLTGLLLGTALFELGLAVGLWALKALGQTLLALGFSAAILETLRLSRGRLGGSAAFVQLWFLTYLWLSLGGHAVPFSNPNAIPYAKAAPIQKLWLSLDIQRFWLLLAVPMAMLASKPLVKALSGAGKKTRKKRVLMALMVGAIALSGALKAYYSLTQPVNEYLPSFVTAANCEIPKEIIDYFKLEEGSGRILAIKCPLWIYLLPSYTGKPLVDGWYPQGKILKILVEINDYRFNDLEASGSDLERMKTWRSLLNKSSLLAINWVMIGDSNATFQRAVMEGFKFKESLVVPYKAGSITVYKAVEPSPLVEGLLDGGSRPLNFSRPSPSEILINLEGAGEGVSSILVKEAYAPGWRAEAGGKTLKVEEDRNGFILIKVDGGGGGLVKLYRAQGGARLKFLSAFFALAILAAPPLILRRRKG